MNRHETDEHRMPRTIGLIAILITVFALATTAVLYVTPFGRHFVAEFAHSGNARVGDQVRVAGIPVGEVRSVRLAGTFAEVGFTLEDGVPIGATTAASVKMLTPIGGRYLELTSNTSGGSPTNGRIPLDRTSVPYELGQVFDASTDKVGQLDGQALASTIEALNSAVDANSSQIPELLQNAKQLTTIAAQQNDSLQRGLRVSHEYTGELASQKKALSKAVAQLAAISRDFGDNRVAIVQAFEGLKRFFQVIHQPTMAFEAQIEPLIEKFSAIVENLSLDDGKMNQALVDMSALSDELVEAASDAGLKIDVPQAACPDPNSGCR